VGYLLHAKAHDGYAVDTSGKTPGMLCTYLREIPSLSPFSRRRKDRRGQSERKSEVLFCGDQTVVKRKNTQYFLFSLRVLLDRKEDFSI